MKQIAEEDRDACDEHYACEYAREIQHTLEVPKQRHRRDQNHGNRPPHARCAGREVTEVRMSPRGRAASPRSGFSALPPRFKAADGAVPLWEGHLRVFGSCTVRNRSIHHGRKHDVSLKRADQSRFGRTAANGLFLVCGRLAAFRMRHPRGETLRARLDSRP